MLQSTQILLAQSDASLPVDLSKINDAASTTLDAGFESLPNIVNKFVPVVLSLAGIILLGVIIFAGFTMLSAADNPEKVEKGKKMLTQGIIGFIIVFAAFWIAQILEVIFNFPIVSGTTP